METFQFISIGVFIASLIWIIVAILIRKTRVLAAGVCIVSLVLAIVLSQVSLANKNSSKIPVIGKPSTDLPAATTEDLPSYTVLSRVNRIDGSGIDGDVLIKGFSKETPLDVREKTLRSIKKIEGFGPVSLYCTEDAHKANMSASFLAEHPKALEDGYLGRLNESGTFIPPIK